MHETLDIPLSIVALQKMWNGFVHYSEKKADLMCCLACLLLQLKRIYLLVELNILQSQGQIRSIFQASNAGKSVTVSSKQGI